MTTDTTTLPSESMRSRVDATVGMVFFVGSWAMTFGTLFLAFLLMRHRAGTWPPPGVTLPSVGVAGLATAVLLLSSFVLHGAVLRGRAGQQSAFRNRWLAATALGTVFAALQSWLWLDLWAVGVRPDGGVYESLFFALTWFHGLHVAGGLAAMLFVVPGIFTRRFGAHRISVIQNIAIFWHFLDVVWVILYTCFFFI